jgi:hypothetical protein
MNKQEMSRLAGGDTAVDEKTFGKWSHNFISRIAGLVYGVVSSCHCFYMHTARLSANPLMLQIVWDNQKKGDRWNNCLVSIDGTDCKIAYQQAAPEAFYTHKHNCSGVKHEVVVCILTGDIVWVMGPFPLRRLARY